MSKLIIVSNRLPLQISINDNKLEVTPSVGGLATGMKSVHEAYKSQWVGWSGLTDEQIPEGLKKEVGKVGGGEAWRLGGWGGGRMTDEGRGKMDDGRKKKVRR